MNPAAVALVALALTAAPATRSAAPVKRSRTAGRVPTTRTPKIPNAAQRRTLVRRSKDRAAVDALSAVLARASRGGGNGFDRRVAQSLHGHGISPKAADALLDARAGGAKQGKQRLSAAVATSARAPMILLRPVITLPPQNVPLPTRYALKARGLVTAGSSTASRTAIAITATPTGTDYTLSTTELGRFDAGAKATDHTVFDQAGQDALIITAVVAGDGARAAAATSEVETLVAIAASVAATLPGEDRLQVLKAMVDYTVALDDLSNDNAPARSVVATHVAEQEWANLWAVDATNAGGLSWKVAVPHVVDGVQHEVLFDVPSSLPAMSTVRLSFSDFAMAGLPANADIEWASFTASIGGATHTFTAVQYDEDTLRLRPLERRVVDGSTALGIRGTVRWSRRVSEEEIRTECRKRSGRRARPTARCRDLRDGRDGPHDVSLDFANGESTEFSASYATKAEGPVRPASPNARPRKRASTTLHARGDLSPRGSLTLRVSAR